MSQMVNYNFGSHLGMNGELMLNVEIEGEQDLRAVVSLMYLIKW